MLKERQKAILMSNLIERKILAEKSAVSLPLLSMSTSNLTFEQQRELLAMQIEHERFKVKAKIDSDLAVAKIRQETMQTRFNFEHELKMDRDGAAVGVGVY